jgi:hypothetical protein
MYVATGEPKIKPEKRLLGYLRRCEEDPCYDAILKFHHDHLDLMRRAKGSKNKHQAWEGGYIDHLVECMMIGELTYENLECIREIPFESLTFRSPFTEFAAESLYFPKESLVAKRTRLRPNLFRVVR